MASELSGVGPWQNKQVNIQLREQGATKWAMNFFASDAPNSVEAIASDYAGRIKVGKLNVDDNQATAARYQVMSIPTLILFKGGEPVHQIIGAMPKSRLVQEIEPVLTA